MTNGHGTGAATTSHVTVVAVIAAIVLAGAALLRGPLATPADPLPLQVGMQPGEASAPIYVADERGFFAENGLPVTMRPYAADAQAIAGRRVNLSEETMAAVWPNHRFDLSLDRSLLTAMSDEARWAIENNLTTATAPPDFREYIDTTDLATVRPGAGSI